MADAIGKKSTMGMWTQIHKNEEAIAAGGGGGGTPLTTEQGGVVVEAATTTMNFKTGMSVTSTGAGAVQVDAVIPSLDTQYEGVSVEADTITLDFTGAGVTVSPNPSGNVTVDIAGGGGSTLGTGFSPKPIATCTGEVDLESGDKTMLYLTTVEHDMTIGKVTVYGNGNSDGEIEVAIYRGMWGGNLIGRHTYVATPVVHGPNELVITAEVGENLDVLAGETIIVGMRGLSAISGWNPIGGQCNMDKMYAQRNTPPGTVIFPATSPDTEDEQWEETEEIFGLTIWADAV